MERRESDFPFQRKHYIEMRSRIFDKQVLSHIRFPKNSSENRSQAVLYALQGFVVAMSFICLRKTMFALRNAAWSKIFTYMKLKEDE